MLGIITHRRILCLSHINCYDGWTNRPYSYLERAVIMVRWMNENGYDRSTQQLALLQGFSHTGHGFNAEELFKGHGMNPMQYDFEAVQVVKDLVGVAEKFVLTHDPVDDLKPDMTLVLWLKIPARDALITRFREAYERLF